MSLMLRSLFLRGITAHSNSLLECRGKCDHLGGDTVTEEQQKHHHPKPKEEINNADLHRLQHKDVVGALRDQFGSVAVSSPNSPASWGDLLPELLGEIMRRVETDNDQWPQRQNVVACGGVCKQWKEAVREAVERSSLRQPGQITFTSSLKKPGPRDSPVQCLVRRDKKTETYFLYLALSQSFTDKGKFLLAAKRYRRGMHWEFIISLDVDDLSQGSKSYLGKIRSNFIGTDFMIYDSQQPHSGAKASTRRACRRIGNEQISPQVPAGNFEIGHVTYKFNLFKSKGPRRMVCFLTRPSHEDVLDNNNRNDLKTETSDPAVVALKNKAPRWHEHLQCWCLNFHGRVTVASVKNFQLVSAGENGDSETVLLQFGKVGDDTFTMSYQYPLSPFQAFAICLTSFGTKLACE